MHIWDNGNLKTLEVVNKFYLLGGVFGVMIVYSVIKGICLLGDTMIDTFRLFGNSQIKFDFIKPLGILVMRVGIIIFKLKGQSRIHL